MTAFSLRLILACCLGLVPRAVLAQDAALDARLQAFFASFQAGANMASAGNVTLERTYVDLGGSAVPEALVVFNGSLFCGSRGCSAFILDMTGPQARSIGDFLAVNFTPLKSRTNGYRDVAMGGAILQFDGTRYRVAQPQGAQITAPAAAPGRRQSGSLYGALVTMQALYARDAQSGAERVSGRKTVTVGEGIELPQARELTNAETMNQGLHIINGTLDVGTNWVRVGFGNAGFGRFAYGYFAGPVLKFEADPPVRITGVTVHPETNLPGFTDAFVSFEGDTLWINTANLAFTPESLITLILTLAE